MKNINTYMFNLLLGCVLKYQMDQGTKRLLSTKRASAYKCHVCVHHVCLSLLGEQNSLYELFLFSILLSLQWVLENCSHVQFLYYIFKFHKEGKGKVSRYRSTWPRGVQEVKAPRFLNNRHIQMVMSTPLRTGHLYPQEYPGTHF